MRGRKTKLSPELQGKICSAIRAGAYDSVAAQAAGIIWETFNRWMKKGEAARSGQFFEFYTAVKKAAAERELRNAAIISKAANESWQAAAWMLERTAPERYARIEKQQITGRDGGPVELLTLDEYREKIAHLAARYRPGVPDGVPERTKKP